jgi:hypothetical protein
MRCVDKSIGFTLRQQSLWLKPSMKSVLNQVISNKYLPHTYPRKKHIFVGYMHEQKQFSSELIHRQRYLPCHIREHECSSCFIHEKNIFNLALAIFLNKNTCLEHINEKAFTVITFKNKNIFSNHIHERENFPSSHLWTGARGNIVGWGNMLQAARSRFRFAMWSLDFSIELNLQAALWPWGRLSL